MKTLVLAVASLFLLAGCVKQVPPSTEVSSKPATPPVKAAKPDTATVTSLLPGIESLTLQFELDSATLAESSLADLQRLAQAMKAHPGAKVHIDGHTCELGTEDYNLHLGNKRAAAARDYLMRLGIEEARLAIISYGELRPVAAGQDEASLRQNRRAEIGEVR
jgi:peptidoglycan-associated lipoprotein